MLGLKLLLRGALELELGRNAQVGLLRSAHTLLDRFTTCKTKDLLLLLLLLLSAKNRLWCKLTAGRQSSKLLWAP